MLHVLIPDKVDPLKISPEQQKLLRSTLLSAKKKSSGNASGEPDAEVADSKSAKKGSKSPKSPKKKATKSPKSPKKKATKSPKKSPKKKATKSPKKASTTASKRPKKSTASVEKEALADGKVYGCARCRFAKLGCTSCRKPGFTPRGPRSKPVKAPKKDCKLGSVSKKAKK